MSKPSATAAGGSEWPDVVRRTQVSCGRDTGLRAPTARTPGPILGDAAIAHLSIAELALNDTKHMLDFRAHLAEPVIAGTLAGRLPAAGFGLVLHRPEHARRLRGALLRVARVALVAIDRSVVIADQTVHQLRIV